MDKNVYVLDTSIYQYNNNCYFNPSEKYEEALDVSIKSDEEIYGKVRDMFILMELDKENIGTSAWNPFKEFIRENDSVIIKPNLVNHINMSQEGTMDSLITNLAIIRPIIDYCILALKGTGKIIVGDAPVQECIFSEIIKNNGLEEAIKEYNKKGYYIELIDFRKKQNENLECMTVKLDEKSSFSELDKIDKEYSITNYDLKLMNAHHSGKVHEYIIPKEIIKADVIINIPKPKTHRKAGMTACMKNFVGINGNKECLPHHRTGGPNKNGDEFPENSILKSFYSWLSKYTYKKNKFINFMIKGISLILNINGKGRFKEGSWYGNDTIWRTILDLNKLILYSNKEGIMTDTVQRKIFNIADMIVAGEKEGPLLPNDKKVGMIVAGFNQLNNDYVIAQIMGFSPTKIKYIENGYKMSELAISNDKDFGAFDENGIIKEIEKYNKHFKATDGWKDYLGVN